MSNLKYSLIIKSLKTPTRCIYQAKIYENNSCISTWAYLAKSEKEAIEKADYEMQKCGWVKE